MKKILVAIITMLALSCGAKADTTTPGQFLLSLGQDVVAVGARDTKGQTRMEFLDGILNVGNYKGQYILAADIGTLDAPPSGTVGTFKGTVGIHAHVLTFLAPYLNLSPDALKFFNYFQFTPRYALDQDIHNWHGVLEVTFGAQIPFN